MKLSGYSQNCVSTKSFSSKNFSHLIFSIIKNQFVSCHDVHIWDHEQLLNMNKRNFQLIDLNMDFAGLLVNAATRDHFWVFFY